MSFDEKPITAAPKVEDAPDKVATIQSFSKIAEVRNKIESSTLSSAKDELLQAGLRNNSISIENFDPDEAAKSTLYYRNFKHGKFSMFSNILEDISIIQDASIIILASMSDTSIYQTPYSDWTKSADAKGHKLGNSIEARNLAEELIVLLRLKENIDYSSVTIRPGPLTLWVLKFIQKHRSVGKENLHVVFSPADHNYLQLALKNESTSLAYKAMTQLIGVIIYKLSQSIVDEHYRTIVEIINGTSDMFRLKSNLSDLRDTEPFYIWHSILSSEEKGILMKKAGDFFKTQAGYLANHRKKPRDISHAEIITHQKEVWSKLKCRSTIYGRMKFYNDLKRDQEVSRILSLRKGTKQLSYTETLVYAQKQGKLSIFATENIEAIELGVCEKPIELIDLTKCVLFRQNTGALYYNWDDISLTQTVRDLEAKAKDDKDSKAASLLTSIMKRTSRGRPLWTET